MDTRPVKIYCIKSIPRLRYIAGLILGDILGLSWDIVTDKRKLGRFPAINYSDENIPGSFKINPVSLLSESGVTDPEIVIGEWKGLPTFFPAKAESDIPFDIFAASFFLITRYEEYLGFNPDEHGRFKASSSIAYKNNFLEIPLVDLWAREFAKVLLKKFQTLTFKRNEYCSLLTVNTDQPDRYHGNILLSSIGLLFRNITGKTSNEGKQTGSVFKDEKDGWGNLDYIFDCVEKTKSTLRLFLPVGDYSKYDKNPSWKNQEYRQLINKIADKYETGITLSYNAALNHSLICAEVSRLKKILNKEVVNNRFNYIRLIFPHSYRSLESAGITEDYSMGYPDEPGFRAGLARPYVFYDLLADQITNLRIFPFQVMDKSLFQNKKLDPEQSMDLILKLINETRKVGGLFISVWHNSSLTEKDESREWKKVFEFMLKNHVKL
jgi:hypothetical protein